MKKVFRIALFPGILLVSYAAFWVLLRLQVPIGLASLGATIANIITIALMERLFPLRVGHNPFKDMQTLNDIVHGLLASEIGGRAARAILDFGLVFVYSIFARSFWPTNLNFWIQFSLAFLIIEVLFYWQHRMFHTIPFFWRFHSLHHNANQMHVMTSARLHFFEIFVRHSIIFGPIVLLGAPAELVFFYLTANNCLGNLAHANLNCWIPRWLHSVLVTPGVHHLHHSQKREQSDSNFGASLAIFDILFGTFRNPEDEAVEAFGIEQDPFGRGLPSQILVPLDPRSQY